VAENFAILDTRKGTLNAISIFGPPRPSVIVGDLLGVREDRGRGRDAPSVPLAGVMVALGVTEREPIRYHSAALQHRGAF
jgi:hypothetical protein